MLNRSLRHSTQPGRGFICLSCLVVGVGRFHHIAPSSRRSLTTVPAESESSTPSISQSGDITTSLLTKSFHAPQPSFDTPPTIPGAGKLPKKSQPSKKSQPPKKPQRPKSGGDMCDKPHQAAPTPHKKARLKKKAAPHKVQSPPNRGVVPAHQHRAHPGHGHAPARPGRSAFPHLFPKFQPKNSKPRKFKGDVLPTKKLHSGVLESTNAPLVRKS
ncbi:hypothetical protein PAAG_11646 [Paracoccidioides lutzii Pb01]|uniref:Uncharacterized protein n=1 Tax=Paracoccidioides lutzii (strain ATCC MYA-826 / Pb01) TaxID=502779 RepID=A0A0A2V6G0_PARBA|nr:hypothetical protein PAAG_11646 [Paracoccidioides lutzii Pb01]KGQ01655.1 hypothetical protein PAAG_11646 [Paracoccidioides lutzii Pb01]